VPPAGECQSVHLLRSARRGEEAARLTIYANTLLSNGPMDGFGKHETVHLSDSERDPAVGTVHPSVDQMSCIAAAANCASTRINKAGARVLRHSSSWTSTDSRLAELLPVLPPSSRAFANLASFSSSAFIARALAMAGEVRIKTHVQMQHRQWSNSLSALSDRVVLDFLLGRRKAMINPAWVAGEIEGRTARMGSMRGACAGRFLKYPQSLTTLKQKFANGPMTGLLFASQAE
jgi:hypothetical protein